MEQAQQSNVRVGTELWVGPLTDRMSSQGFSPACAFTVRDTRSHSGQRFSRRDEPQQVSSKLCYPRGHVQPGSVLTTPEQQSNTRKQAGGSVVCQQLVLYQYLSRGSSARATCSRASLVRALQRKMCRTTVNRSNTCTRQAASSSFWRRRVCEGTCWGAQPHPWVSGKGDLSLSETPCPLSLLGRLTPGPGKDGGQHSGPRVPWWAQTSSPRSGK